MGGTGVEDNLKAQDNGAQLIIELKEEFMT